MTKILNAIMIALFQFFLAAPPELQVTHVSKNAYRTIKNKKGTLYVDPRVLKLVERFEAEFRTRMDPNYRVDNVTIKVVDHFPFGTPKLWIGFCRYKKKIREVELLRAWIEKETPASVEVLVFHELGHCLLNQDHRDAKFGNDAENPPVSVMNSTVLPSKLYEKGREYYMRELMGRGIMPGPTTGCRMRMPDRD